ncbi:MAG: type II and III secretion system protein [Verrucomicrobiota bacterium]
MKLFKICRHLLAATTVLFSALTTMASAQDAETITMRSLAGQTIIVPIESPDSVLIDRRDIVDYLEDVPPSETRLLLSAITRGEAFVTVEKDGVTTIYSITVEDPTQVDLIKMLKEMVGDPNLNAVFLAGGRLLLEGNMKNDLSYRKALQIATAMTPDVLDLMSIENPSQIRIKTQILEVNVTRAKEIGLQYQGGAGGDPDNGISGVQGAIPFGISSIAGAPYFQAVNQIVGADFNALLSLAQSQNVARILQEPTLTVLNGQPAIFRVGGEIPIITTNVSDGISTESVEFRPFGISLIVTPVLEANDGLNPFYAGGGETGPNQTVAIRNAPNVPELNRPTIYENGIIKLFVRPEISNVDFTQTFGINDTPLFTTRYVESRVALKDKQPLVIGGLYDENESKRLQEVPFLSKIPVLGELFKQRRNSSDRLELVFILTPEIMDFNGIENDLIDYPVKLAEAEQYMGDSGIERYAVKPTRINANNVWVRGGDIVPLVRDLQMTESEGMPGYIEPEYISFEGVDPLMQDDVEKGLPDDSDLPKSDNDAEENSSELQPSQGLPDLQPRPAQ